MTASFLPSGRSTPQPFWNVQCTYTKWVTQLFRPHLLHSCAYHPGKRWYIRLKWHTLKYSKRELSSSICTKSSPKLFPAPVMYIHYIIFYTPPKTLLITPEKRYIIYFIRSLQQLKKALSLQVPNQFTYPD